MSIDRQLLGKAIRRVRELRGFSQAGLAHEAGLRGNSVALIERGQRGISMETLNDLADALNIPASCLAILGTSKIARQTGSEPLVKSMQKLILATVVAQATLEAKEESREATAPKKSAGKRRRTPRKKKPARRKSTTMIEPASKL